VRILPIVLLVLAFALLAFEVLQTPGLATP